MSRNRGTVRVKFTIGFGNNLFQYTYGRLFAETNGLNLDTEGLPQIDLPESRQPFEPSLKTRKIRDKKTSRRKLRSLLGNAKNANYELRGYFEDHRIYRPYLDRIRSWFRRVEKTNTRDLILHLRLQNRLVEEGSFVNFVSPEGYIRAFEQFEFERLHIVTDAAKWDPHDEQDIRLIRNESRARHKRDKPFVPIEASIAYMNALVDAFRQFDPVIHCKGGSGEAMIEGSGGHRGGYIEDFDLIRSFDKIIVHNSTFAWWAAVLSEASRVGVFGPWKPAKGRKGSNLGGTDYEGWFSWGTKRDAYPRTWKG